jgi:phosphatidylinositol glycan class S
MVLYIPSRSLSPLHIVQSNGLLLDTNAFLVPQWGGIKIHNIAFNDRKQPINLGSGQLHEIMELYVEQLRKLLGVKPISIKHQQRLLVFFYLN